MMTWMQFLGGAVALATLVAVLMNFMGRASRVQSELESKLSRSEHNEICERRENEAKELIKEVITKLDKHIESRADVDKRAADFRHTMNNDMHEIKLTIAVMKATLTGKAQV